MPTIQVNSESHNLGDALELYLEEETLTEERSQLLDKFSEKKILLIKVTAEIVAIEARLDNIEQQLDIG